MDILSSMGISDTEQLATDLAGLSLVDVGTITSFEVSTGRCSALGFQVINGQQTAYTNAEVIFMGGGGNGFQHDVVNAACLIFTPRSTVVSLRDPDINTTDSMYSKAGVKCLPINCGTNTSLRMGFSADGNFQIAGEKFTAVISADGISYNSADKKFHYSLNGSDVTREEGAGNISDVVGSDGSYEWVFTRVTDGWITKRVYYAPDGAITEQLNQQADMTPEEMDTPSTFVNYTRTRVISPTGAITDTLKKSDGSTLRTFADNVDGSCTLSWPGNGTTLNVTADGEITLKGANGLTLDADGGMLTLKNAQSSVYQVFNALLQLLNGGTIATAGSPASHTITAGQFQQVITELGKVMNA